MKHKKLFAARARSHVRKGFWPVRFAIAQIVIGADLNNQQLFYRIKRL